MPPLSRLRSTRSTSRTTSRRRHGNLLVTEDPSSANQYDSAASAEQTTARLWKVPLGQRPRGREGAAARGRPGARREREAPHWGEIDVDAAGAAKLGAWESSGIVDASAAFGPGAFFLTIQAHSYWIEKQAGPDGSERRDPSGRERCRLLLQEGRRAADPAEDARRLASDTACCVAGASTGPRRGAVFGARPLDTTRRAWSVAGR